MSFEPTLNELGDLWAAKDHVIYALRLAPVDAWSYVVLGIIFTREQDWNFAFRFFTKASDTLHRIAKNQTLEAASVVSQK